LKEIFFNKLDVLIIGDFKFCVLLLVFVRFLGGRGDLLVLLTVFCKIDKLTLLSIKLINILSTFRRCQDSREKNHFDIDCLYYRQGNEQKQVAVQPNLKSPSIRTPSLLKKSLSISKYLYPFKRVSTPIRR
jgi:hypothetical protein